MRLRMPNIPRIREVDLRMTSCCCPLVQKLWAQQMAGGSAGENGRNLAFVIQARQWNLCGSLLVLGPLRYRDDRKPCLVHVEDKLQRNGMLLPDVGNALKETTSDLWELSGTFFATLVPLRRTKLVRRSRDAAHGRPSKRLPPNSLAGPEYD